MQKLWIKSAIDCLKKRKLEGIFTIFQTFLQVKILFTLAAKEESLKSEMANPAQIAFFKKKAGLIESIKLK